MGRNWSVLSSCTVAVCCVLSLCAVGVLVTLTGCDEILVGVSVWVWVWVWVQWQAKTAANTATVVFGPARKIVVPPSCLSAALPCCRHCCSSCVLSGGGGCVLTRAAQMYARHVTHCEVCPKTRSGTRSDSEVQSLYIIVRWTTIHIDEDSFEEGVLVVGWQS